VTEKTLKLSEQPLKLESTRVWRTYSGGKVLEEWQGRPDPQDGDRPEEWIASVTRARNNRSEASPDEGLSEVSLAGDATVLLKALIDADPEAFLGAEHVRRYGANTAVLVKALDSRSRLAIQVHPDRDFARDVFHSAFGKTEAWYALGGREIGGEPPYLLFGFKPGVTREKWRELFEKQDIPGMVDCLHRIPLVPGETLLIEGGVPHAIGSGCFLLEIQEPTDYTIRVERTTPEGKPIPDELCHQGIGFEKIFDCFHYEALTLEETLARYRIPPVVLDEGDGFRVIELIGAGHTDKFRLQRLEVGKALDCRNDGQFSILAVLAGSGRIRYSDRVMALRQSQTVFLPAGLTVFRIEGDPGHPLELVRCFPPR
jgi:mannose-6-phosphate isomerase